MNIDWQDMVGDYGDMVGSGYVDTVYDDIPKRPDDPAEELNELDFEDDLY